MILPQHEDRVDTVIAYLNERAARRYRARHPNGELTANGTYVAARLKQGYTDAQLRAVVDVKADEWGSTSMRKFLRPETSFRWKTKFEQYLAQAEEPQDVL